MALKSLLKTSDLTPADFTKLLDLSAMFKKEPHKHADFFKNETVVLYFNKPSTRTRLSFSAAVARLGGTAVTCGANDLQLGRGETIEDTARVVARYAKGFVLRTYKDSDVAEVAAASSVPVINALTDGHHPCQSVADLLTLREHKGDLKGLKMAYLGDGNNVTHSLMEACALTGTHCAVATPKGYEPDAAITAKAREIGKQTGAEITITNDPAEAAKNADALYGDVWLSMGDPDDEKQKRISDLKPYQVNAELMKKANKDAIFMHCLPAHRGEEVTAEIIDGPQSVVFDEAENRMHTSMAILYALSTGELTGA